jgi:hypothetical protein
MAHSYPPLPVLLAGILPGGALGLSVVASVVGGITLHRTLELLVRRRTSTGLIWCVLPALFAVPAVVYAASQSVATIASLALLVVALEGFGAFGLGRSTEARFRTGLALAAALLFDPLATFLELCSVPERSRSVRHVPRDVEVRLVLLAPVDRPRSELLRQDSFDPFVRAAAAPHDAHNCRGNQARQDHGPHKSPRHGFNSFCVHYDGDPCRGAVRTDLRNRLAPVVLPTKNTRHRGGRNKGTATKLAETATGGAEHRTEAAEQGKTR